MQSPPGAVAAHNFHVAANACGIRRGIQFTEWSCSMRYAYADAKVA